MAYAGASTAGADLHVVLAFDRRESCQNANEYGQPVLRGREIVSTVRRVEGN